MLARVSSPMEKNIVKTFQLECLLHHCLEERAEFSASAATAVFLEFMALLNACKFASCFTSSTIVFFSCARGSKDNIPHLFALCSMHGLHYCPTPNEVSQGMVSTVERLSQYLLALPLASTVSLFGVQR
mmetsp:Transcript_24937/g.68749  ORF Transcript_24937/g.68749 Transcript_24937/m.68749 type:complete len:129 (-) Transcript_24937:306-692(-)